MKKHLAAKNYSRCNFSWKKEASRKSAMKFRSRIFLQKRVQKKGERERGRKGKYSFRIKNQFPFLSLCRFYAPTHVPLLSRQDFIHSSYDVPSPLSIIRFHPLSPCYLPRQTSRDILSPRSFEPRHEYRRTTSVLEKPENRKAIEKKGRDGHHDRFPVVACKQRCAGLPKSRSSTAIFPHDFSFLSRTKAKGCVPLVP